MTTPRLQPRHLAMAALVTLATCWPGSTATAAVPARPDSAHFFSVPAASMPIDTQVLRDQVRDPLFAFVFIMTACDSLGTWDAGDLLEFAEGWGEDSAFPLREHLASLTRERDDDGARHRGVGSDRRWVVRLKPARLEMPMPYSILGYHPGALSFDSPLVIREWPLGARGVYVTVEGATRRYDAEAITVYQVEAGWIVLDVDGWIDKLLGKAADDAAMQGFAVGWVDGEIVGVGNSLGRDGRLINGELDFQSGEIAAHGRPVAVGISRYARGWTSPGGVDAEAAWSRYDP